MQVPVLPTTAQIILVEDEVNKKKAMKRLTCRKCEGHGMYAILKGHAGVCPFKDCSCGTCASVMSMRANALIRRFRHRQPDQSMAVVKALRSKNGNMRLRIVARNEETLMEADGTLVTYSNDKNGHQTYTTSNRRSSVMTDQSAGDDRDSIVSTPPGTTNNSTPSGSPPLLMPFGEMDGTMEMTVNFDPLALVRATLLQQLLANPSALSPAAVAFLLQTSLTQQPKDRETSLSLPPPVLFPSLLAVPSL
ncbi:unnamed protein product [Caenorhabditis sp. 36 PRJEB53466]|nr:unnamed protein product [Caenorhabditis sp. 36 PRJEB53466]